MCLILIKYIRIINFKELNKYYKILNENKIVCVL